MQRYWLLLLGSLSMTGVFAQKIHAHNDYEQPRPFLSAYEQRADYIEADVWLQDGKLVVSHEKPGPSAPSLDSLYLKPIAALFAKYDGRVSADRSYSFGLMIDVKDDPAVVLPRLVELLQTNLTSFNRNANASAVQVIISGNRPRPDKFFDYPLLQFDGRPSEVYDSETLQKVAMVSDNFQSYTRWNGTGDLSEADRDKLKRVIKRAHSDGRLVRFWAIPDQPDAWKTLRKLGVDVINTDHVADAAKALR